MRASQPCGPPLAVALSGVAREKGADGGLVGKDGGGVDAGGGDLRVACENELGVFERAGGVAGVAGDAGDFDEGGDGIGEFGDDADEGEGVDVRGELWPALEAVFAGEDELGVGEGEGSAADCGRGSLWRRGWWRWMRSSASGWPQTVRV